MQEQDVGDETSCCRDYLGWSRQDGGRWFAAKRFLACSGIRNATGSEVAPQHPHRLMDSPRQRMCSSCSEREGETRRWLGLWRPPDQLPPCSTRREQPDLESIRAGDDAQRAKVASTEQREARTGKDVPVSNRKSSGLCPCFLSIGRNTCACFTGCERWQVYSIVIGSLDGCGRVSRSPNSPIAESSAPGCISYATTQGG